MAVFIDKRCTAKLLSMLIDSIFKKKNNITII